MEYRSLADLSQAVTANLYKIPRDVDLIAAIPRSGLLAGSLISLSLNIPLIDLDGFIQSRNGFPRRTKHVLIVDDSIYSGKSMAYAKELIKPVISNQKITCCTVYANPQSLHLVDIYFETLSSPGCQEWNIMHRDKLENFCVDIDGVLCSNPEKKEDDDGPAYREFLRNARPLLLPSHKIGYLVTSRLEKYREETVYWLDKHDVQYKELLMLDLPDAETRWKLRAAGKFKAKIYRKISHAPLFIESEQKEAKEIARLSGKRVLCFYDQKVYVAKNYRSRVIRKAKAMARSLIKTSNGFHQNGKNSDEG